MPHLWMSATNRHIDNPRCKAKNRCQSVHAHFQNGAMTKSLSVVPITGVSNGSGPTVRVGVWVGTNPVQNWQFGSSIHPHRQFWSGSMGITQPV